MNFHDHTDDLPDAEYEARYGRRRGPLPPHRADLRSGQIRPYRIDRYGDDVCVPCDRGTVALWPVVGPVLAAMMICAWAREWSQTPMGAQMELDL